MLSVSRIPSILTLCLLLVLSLSISACDSGGSNPPPDENPSAESIGDYIAALTYDADALLNVQPSDSARQVIEETDTTETVGNEQRTCTSTSYDLRTNFSDIAILRPTQDVVWPGALVEANASLLDNGIPELARFERTPVKVRVDLPGIGANGTKTVDNPDQARVQDAIDESLEWWNANAYQDGYRNASSSSNRITTSYSSTQASLDVGLNVAWATGDVESQFNFETSQEKRVIMSTYKQAFYTVTFVQENGAQPEDVFGPSVSAEAVSAAFGSDSPPAYIASVTYGRIIMFRMETSSSFTRAEAEAAFKYAAGASVDGSFEGLYEDILESSTVEVITLGGNASVASQAITARSAGDLVPIITGENAVYSRSNPGVPISYTVKFLQDDRLAKLGYTTEYTATECSSIQTQNTITISLKQFEVVEDCEDGFQPGSGAGEFEYTVNVKNNGTNVYSTYYDERPFNAWREVKLDDGGTDPINHDEVFTAEREAGYDFSVNVQVRERDVGGLDLNEVPENVHEFNEATGWSNLPETEDEVLYLVASDSDDCKAQVNYTVTVN